MRNRKEAKRYGGGIHGIEWDNGFIWVTAFNPKAIYKVDAAKEIYSE